MGYDVAFSKWRNWNWWKPTFGNFICSIRWCWKRVYSRTSFGISWWNKTKNLALCPVYKTVDVSHFRDFMKKNLLHNKEHFRNLICDQTERKENTFCYRNLKLLVGYGMDNRKKKRVLKFEQRPWMKFYIDKKHS